MPTPPKSLNFAIEQDDIALDDVVVSANRNETKRKLAPNLVNVLSPKLFDATQSVCLAQGLNFQPESGQRTTVRIAASHKYASTDLTVTTLRY